MSLTKSQAIKFWENRGWEDKTRFPNDKALALFQLKEPRLCTPEEVFVGAVKRVLKLKEKITIATIHVYYDAILKAVENDETMEDASISNINITNGYRYMYKEV